MTPALSNPLDPLPSGLDELHSELARYFLETAHPDRPQLLGLEFECLRVARQGLAAAPSTGSRGPDELVLALGRELGDIEERVDGGVLSAVHVGPTNLSLEPGGQIEVSLPPVRTPLQAQEALGSFIGRLEARLAGSPFRALYLGHQPCTMPEEIALRAKPRYRIMDRRLRQSGDLGIHMMRATAGMQVTLDYRDAEDCATLMRAALLMAPFVTALFANSPLVGGVDSGCLSFRGRVWWRTDPSRCGAPAALVGPNPSLRDYVDFALAAELWFVERGGELVEVPGRRSFREVWGEGDPVLTLADFHLHSTTLFPEVRLRGGVEVRTADCVPPQYAASFLALNAACLYDREARETVAELHPYRSAEALAELHDVASREGLEGSLRDGFRIGDACERMLAAAGAGLERLLAAGAYPGECRELLDPLKDLCARRTSFAAESLDRISGRSRACGPGTRDARP
ncbi:MAG: glutamate-cysteine ligase family protein [Planctomycetota bacterium]